MYASPIATLSATEYVILHNMAQCSSLNAMFNLTDESRPTTCNRGRPPVGGEWRQHDHWLTVKTIYTIYTLTPERISQGHMQNGRRATFSWPILHYYMWKHESWYEIPLAYTNVVTTVKTENTKTNWKQVHA